MQTPTVVAHRGFSAIAPENTLPAFLRAIDAGADMIELDVRLTADHRLVVIHDATLERTTNGRGAVAHQTLDEPRRLDAGAWFGPVFAGAIVPTLDEDLEVCRGRVLANIEVKTEERGVVPLDRLADLVAARVSDLGAIPSVVVSSHNRRVVSRLHDIDRRLATALLSDRLFTSRHATMLAREAGALALHVPHRLATAQLAGSGTTTRTHLRGPHRQRAGRYGSGHRYGVRRHLHRPTRPSTCDRRPVHRVRRNRLVEPLAWCATTLGQGAHGAPPPERSGAMGPAASDGDGVRGSQPRLSLVDWLNGAGIRLVLNMRSVHHAHHRQHHSRRTAGQWLCV